MSAVRATTPILVPAAVGAEGAERRRPRVLLAEDEEAVGNLVRDVLEDEGYDVVLVRHPHVALELAAAWSFELLITDLVMPEMSGQQLAEALRERQPQIHVLFMSGYAGTAVIERGLLDPGSPFLQKPFRVADLVRTVRGIVDEPCAAA